MSFCIFARFFKYFGSAYNCSCSYRLDRCHVLYVVCTQVPPSTISSWYKTLQLDLLLGQKRVTSLIGLFPSNGSLMDRNSTTFHK